MAHSFKCLAVLMAQLLAVLYFSNCVHCVCVSVHMSVSALKRLEA